MGYSIQVEGKVGKARLEGVDASFKDLCAVCDNIRNMLVDEAFALLELAAEGKFPIYYRRHNKKLGHRRELGGKKGRYPRKAAKIVMKVLKAAVASAQQKGVKGELFVLHAAANKKGIFPRLQPKGRRIRHDYELARVEIIVAGVEPLEEGEEDKKEKEMKQSELTKEEPKPAKLERMKEKEEKEKKVHAGEEGKEEWENKEGVKA